MRGVPRWRRLGNVANVEVLPMTMLPIANERKAAMKKTMLAFGRFMYGNWYGAVVVFVAVAAVLYGLQFANCCMRDLVPWPKDIHILIIDVPLPDTAALSHCDGREGNITIIEANGKTYLVYKRL